MHSNYTMRSLVSGYIPRNVQRELDVVAGLNGAGGGGNDGFSGQNQQRLELVFLLLEI